MIGRKDFLEPRRREEREGEDKEAGSDMRDSSDVFVFSNPKSVAKTYSSLSSCPSRLRGSKKNIARHSLNAHLRLQLKSVPLPEGEAKE